MQWLSSSDKYCIVSGAPAAKRNPLLIDPSISVFMFIVASGMAHGRVLTTTPMMTITTYVAQHGGQILDGSPCYGQLTAVKTRYPLISITWPYRGIRFRAHRGHVFNWSWRADQILFSIESRARLRFFFLDLIFSGISAIGVDYLFRLWNLSWVVAYVSQILKSQ